MRSERDNPILKGLNVFGDPASVELFKDARPQCGESCTLCCLSLIQVLDKDYPGKGLDGYYCGATGAYIPFPPGGLESHLKAFGGPFGKE